VAGEVDPGDASDLESQVRMEETDDAVPA
jgi:hypothetical protein